MQDEPMDRIKDWVFRASRRGVEFDAIAHRRDGTDVPIALQDISYDGCCISPARKFEVGEQLGLFVLGLGAIDAQVRWCDKNKAGMAFSVDTVPATKRLSKKVAARGRLPTINVPSRP